MKNFLLDTKNSYKVKIATKDDSNEITKLEEIIFSDDSNSVSFINEIKYENKYHILLVRKIFERNNFIINLIKNLLKLRNSFSTKFINSQNSDFISGFIGIWFYEEESYISTFGVREFERGKGLGELLLIQALYHVICKGGKSMSLEVRKSNFQAIDLYKKYGFHKVGMRKFYYSNDNEDAIIMTANDIDSEEYKNRILFLINLHSEKWNLLDKIESLK
ncbi:MAG: GNAT family N-acetyltransferase [SAR202 cluster bacterium]|nr:GNAT family N-acetyltransferase [SAR202 cluster bacterium]|tara:strand:+ start:1019 stop:1675 length:657 start_codon:yes stop_codon:yes gene_type:complete